MGWFSGVRRERKLRIRNVYLYIYREREKGGDVSVGVRTRTRFCCHYRERERLIGERERGRGLHFRSVWAQTLRWKGMWRESSYPSNFSVLGGHYASVSNSHISAIQNVHALISVVKNIFSWSGVKREKVERERGSKSDPFKNILDG